MGTSASVRENNMTIAMGQRAAMTKRLFTVEADSSYSAEWIEVSPGIVSTRVRIYISALSFVLR